MLRILISISGIAAVLAATAPAIAQFTSSLYPDPATGRVIAEPFKGTVVYFDRMNDLFYRHGWHVALAMLVVLGLYMLLQMIVDDRRANPR